MNRLINLLLLFGIGAAVIASFVYLGIDMLALTGGDSLGQMAGYVRRFLSPDLSAEHLSAISRGALETLAMSALGTLLAAVLGLALALPAAGRFGWPLQSAARLLLNALRAIPELVWAALMVFAAGLGPNAGTLALALETRDAARARGLGRHPRVYLTPFVVRVVARAHEQGDALAARGLGD